MSVDPRSAPAPAAQPEHRPRAHLQVVEAKGAGDGRARSRPRAPRPSVSTQAAIVGLVIALCAIGLVMVLSASAYTSLQYYGSVWTIFERQMLWMGLGAVVFGVTLRIRYDWWRRLRILLPLGTLLLLVAVLVPGIGVEAGGSSRWIGAGALRLQPSELMKLALAIFAADLLARRADRLDRPGAVVVPLLVLLAVSGVLVLKQPDMGTALVLALITFALLYAGGVPLRPVAKALGVTAVIGLIAGLVEPYRRARLLSFLDPFAHAKGSGYQVVQSLVGLGSGHLYGLGLGGGREKWGLLPNAHTDFIFSVIGEEGGLIGTLIVVGLFGALAWYGLRAASRAPDRFGGLLAVAATCWITSQAVINMGAVIGVLPVTGIPLPFISFGGSSLVITLVAAGILGNVAAHELPTVVSEHAPPAPGARASVPTSRGRDRS
jgi:cell division protein FtsW